MIRPSQLQIAEKCGLAPRLAEQFPETSEAATRGTRIHEEIANCLRLANCEPREMAATWAIDWLHANGYAMPSLVEHPVALVDPETGDEITRGTADLIAADAHGVPVVIDWKSGRPENQPPVEESLQLAAYAIGHALTGGINRVGWRMVFVDERAASDTCYIEGASMWTWLARIKAAASKPAAATPGDHCGRCYQRPVCPSHRERTTTSLVLLGRSDLQMTDEIARDLVFRVAEVRRACDLAEEMAKMHVLGGGNVVDDNGRRWRPTTVAGRRTGPSVKELESQGLGHLVKQGAPSERWGWTK